MSHSIEKINERKKSIYLSLSFVKGLKLNNSLQIDHFNFTRISDMVQNQDHIKVPVSFQPNWKNCHRTLLWTRSNDILTKHNDKINECKKNDTNKFEYSINFIIFKELFK